MNIFEAVKSGKKFKRKNWVVWYEGKDEPAFMLSDILAEDWEVEEPKKKKTAWIDENGQLLLKDDSFIISYSGKKPDLSKWKRAPWLDEP